MNIEFLHWQNLPFLWYILCNFSYSKSTHYSWKYETNCNWVFFSEHSADTFIVVRNSTHLLYLVHYEQQQRENSTSSTKSEEKQEKSFDW